MKDRSEAEDIIIAGITKVFTLIGQFKGKEITKDGY
jgi:hypothetical protein